MPRQNRTWNGRALFQSHSDSETQFLFAIMTTPSKPVTIAGRPRAEPIDGVSGSFSTTYGTPELRALRAQYAGTPPPPNIPLRAPGSASPAPGVRPLPDVPMQGSPASAALGLPASFSSASPALQPRTERSNSNTTATPNIDLEELTDEEKARVLRLHLVSKQEREAAAGGAASSDVEAPVGGPSSRRSSFRAPQAPREAEAEPETFPIPYHAPGADVTHDIYKWQSDQRRLAARTRSHSVVLPPSTAQHPAFEHIHEPGGFRRNYLLLRASERGEDQPPILNNFIEFLYIFGHFAGEDLEDDEGEEDEEDAEAAAAGPPDENEPLLGTSSGARTVTKSRRAHARRRTSTSRGPHGTATVPQAVLMLLKAFVGTGVLFLGKAFFNGGILFSSLLFVFIALISLYSFLLLVYTKFVVSGSFGDIGGILYGPWMRYLILGSIVVSQIGFVAAYIIFVSQNLQALIMGITHCLTLVPLHWLILAQTVVFLPLVLFRDLAKLSTTALVADGFILVGLVYIFGSEISIVAERGIADVALFNPKDFSLFVGVAVFSFEGVGMVIPITDAMREPHKFPKVLTGVMLGVLGGPLWWRWCSCLHDLWIRSADCCSGQPRCLEQDGPICTSFSTLSVALRSADSPQVQFIYSLAIMLSVPLQLFPAIRIIENGIFTRSGKVDFRVKWSKNIFRFTIVFLSAFLSWLGAADLDKFVAFIGCFACVPLCYVYPAMLHFKACADTPRKKAADIAMIVFGLVAAAYTTLQTVKLMIEPDNGGPPVFGNC
ncbi:unnamed protein product [Mycena citricolor]|uniref:Amino acid transporter transmembrane domain-containing protein n=1 Tax=Mycena citricolor TaxID=2018698 RepID=A0AAD2JZ34_9AGAR|nr:unnamed protein product [Mycena citricolor]